MGTLSRSLAAGALGLICIAGAARADVGPNAKPTEGGMVFANVSISVADMDKSTKFYQALGFEIGDAHDVPAAVAKALGSKAKDPKLAIRFVKRDGIVLELIHLIPSPKKAASGGSAEQLGLCHIAFRVDDVDRVAKLVKENGGKTDDALRTKLGPMDILFATDPDGTHIEIAGPAKS